MSRVLFLGVKKTDSQSRGGIRGIVELEVLSAIERYLGGKIPIQDFFDLIVGTRYVVLATILH